MPSLSASGAVCAESEEAAGSMSATRHHDGMCKRASRATGPLSGSAPTRRELGHWQLATFPVERKRLKAVPNTAPTR